MIARGSQDEDEARRHIALWRGMIGRWNAEADSYRQAARGKSPVWPYKLDEAERTRETIQSALELADLLTENLGPGHELRSELFRISAALEALSGSMEISVDKLAPRVRASQDIAGLTYLVAALKKDAGLVA